MPKTKTTNTTETMTQAQPAAPVAPIGQTLGAQPPRQGSKQALVVGLLTRADGASLQDMIAATGWLPHTTRAALTGLRRRGFAIARSSGEEGASVYRIAAPEPAAKPTGRRRAKDAVRAAA